MPRITTQALTIGTLVMAVAGAAESNPTIATRTKDLQLEIVLEESSMLQYGGVVGRLFFHNRSSSDLAIYPFSRGNLLDIENPDGSSVTLEIGYRGIADVSSDVSIAPRGRANRPICLVESEDGFVFAEPGRYRIRGRYRPALGPADEAGAASEWVSVVVKPARDGLEVWRGAIGDLVIESAFSLADGPERWRQQLHRFLDYRHEMVKLILYQYEGPGIRGVLVGRKPLGSLEEVAAEIMLAVAQAARIGQPMWEWIQAALLSSGRRTRGSGGAVTMSDGYFF